MQGQHYISLRDGVKRFPIFTPRHVPFLLMPKVPNYESISKIEQPTGWCTGIAVVSKPANFIDLIKLNENVRHILPSVNYTLAQLTGATIFTKLDANAGFLLMKLTEEYSFYTTFITPFETSNFPLELFYS